MAAVQRYVNTAAAAGGDGTTNNTSGATAAYQSLSSFVANYTASATDDITVDCAGTTADNIPVALNFATTPNSITIRGNRSDSAGYASTTTAALISPNHYRLTSASATNLSIQEPNVTVDGIQIENTSGLVFRSCIDPRTWVGTTIRKCRIRANTYGAIGTNASNTNTSGTTLIENNLLVLLGTSNNAVIRLDVGANNSPTINIYNNTCYSSGAQPHIRTVAGGGAGVQTVNIKNNAFANSTAPFAQASTFTITYDTNATDTGAFGTTNEKTIGSFASCFVSASNASTASFVLVSTTSPLYNAGITISTITDDVQGNARSDGSYDIGAFELQTSGGVTTATVVGADANHNHTADVGTLFQSHVFVAADTSHAHTPDVGSFAQTHVLSGQDTNHDHTADVTNFSATQTVSPADTSHANTPDVGTFAQTHVLTGQDTSHTDTPDVATFTAAGSFAAQDTNHDHTAQSGTFTQTHILVGADASHAHTPDAGTVAQTHLLAGQATSHDNTPDVGSFAAGSLFSPADTSHGHTASAASFVQTHLLVGIDSSHDHTAADDTLAQIHALVAANATHGNTPDQTSFVSFVAGPATLNTLTLDARRPDVTFDVTGRSVSV